MDEEFRRESNPEVVIYGPAGSGKTTLGRRIREEMGDDLRIAEFNTLRDGGRPAVVDRLAAHALVVARMDRMVVHLEKCRHSPFHDRDLKPFILNEVVILPFVVRPETMTLDEAYRLSVERGAELSIERTGGQVQIMLYYPEPGDGFVRIGYHPYSAGRAFRLALKRYDESMAELKAKRSATLQ